MESETHSLAEVKKAFPDISPRSMNIKNAAQEINFLLTILTGERPADWQRVQGIQVLDLGCGTVKSDWEKTTPEPHFCRLLATNGATVYGIDKYEASEEDARLYTHIVSDLAQLVANRSQLAELPELADKQFDVIHSSRFMAGRDPSPSLEAELDSLNISMTEFRQSMIDQSKPLLKDGGIIMFEDRYYKKQNDQLIQINLV